MKGFQKLVSKNRRRITMKKSYGKNLQAFMRMTCIRNHYLKTKEVPNIEPKFK